MKINLSLRELILIIAFCALAIASLRTGGLLASLTVFAGTVTVMTMAIIAFVGHGHPKAFAIGFMLPIVVYSATILASPANEMDPYAGRLPTTQALRFAHRALVTTTWADAYTGEIVPDYDPTQDATALGGGGFGGPTMVITEDPDRPTFMSLAHLVLAITLGWMGGKFAVYIHRTQDPSHNNHERLNQQRLQRDETFAEPTA